MASIGVFDSGFGGLTVLRDLKKLLPQYNYLYLGDNARTPYGNRSFETVYHYTRQAVKWMLDQDCQLVIIACNTASAKALRTIQQRDLTQWSAEKRVLGVIRPTAEVIGTYSKSGTIGILATTGTVNSESYLMEIKKFFPGLKVLQQACPLWVPLIENNEVHTEGAQFFIERDVKRLLNQSPEMDTILLGCTHYPLIINQIKEAAGAHIRIVSQGSLTAGSLKDYLNRHPEIENKCRKDSVCRFYTTDDASDFEKLAVLFYGETVRALHTDFFTPQGS
ncbi:MAG: glutamate racemase [Chitinophagaceae bacterium]|nr:glutamate racemase [Chitinophagaceae bacterium]MCW5914564.1 glutamate racemase [Chitinophagaceae bacterium]MCZ2395331.1 glutamate racemase [Chitinophagales bacterium]